MPTEADLILPVVLIIIYICGLGISFIHGYWKGKADGNKEMLELQREQQAGDTGDDIR